MVVNMMADMEVGMVADKKKVSYIELNMLADMLADMVAPKRDEEKSGPHVQCTWTLHGNPIW